MKKQICSNSINQTSFDAYDRILCSMSASVEGDVTHMVNSAKNEEIQGIHHFHLFNILVNKRLTTKKDCKLNIKDRDYWSIQEMG